MVTIDIKRQKPQSPEYKMFCGIEMPAVPQQGDYLSSDKDGFNGTVRLVSYYWDEEGELHIEVMIR